MTRRTIVTSAPRSVSRCRGRNGGEACEYHAHKTREKYAATLEAIGCICRAILALGQKSCCQTEVRSSTDRKRRSRASSTRRSVDSCCATGSNPRGIVKKSQLRPNNSCSSSKDGCTKGCCDVPKTPPTADSCADECCAETQKDSVHVSREVFSDVARAADLEKGAFESEHVILSISGMTCTGCETKLKRTLGSVAAVNNLKASLILSRAEFDLNVRSMSVVDIMKHLERTTEFKCDRVTTHGSSIALIVPDSTQWIDRARPEGVTDITVIDNKTINVAFDAKIVGARTLVEESWGTPMQLAPPRLDPALEAGSRHVRNVGLTTLLSAILTIPVLVMAWAPLPKHEVEYASASFALATIVQLVIAGPFYPTALKSLVFSRMIEMDLLIVLSTSAAYIFSIVSFGYLIAGHPLSTGEFFETSTLLVTLIMVGRYVSSLARQRAVESISIRSLQMTTAILVDSTGNERELDTRLLQYGDIFKVVPDSRIPTDGTVLSGDSEVDESMITGESKPVEKHVESTVIAGSVNGSGTLMVRLARLPNENTISTIAEMVDEAKLSKPKMQAMADRVASYFVPAIVVLTIATFVIWIAVGVAVRNQSGSEATIQAVTYAITVLIVSCPCAVGLAIPMVIVVATGVASEKGVIFKSADSIEVAYRTSHVVFDKTGTLTQGKLVVAREEYSNRDPAWTKSLVLGLLDGIKHPVSAAVTAHLKTDGVVPVVVSGVKTVTGKGVEGNAFGMVVRAGNSRWLSFSADPLVQSVLLEGRTAFCVTADGTLVAVFALEDSVRPDALDTTTKLQKSGISVHLISGDDEGAVSSVATQLGIPMSNVRSRCSPGDKQAYIQHLLEDRTSPLANNKRKNEEKPVVVFCGDGTNDAVALAQATIGIHMNEGTDVAQSAADVVLMRPNLSGILTTIAISKKAVNRIRFNFSWSFVYNLFAILLGAGAFVRARIPPEFAGLGELVSVLPVIAAAVALRWSKV